MKQTDTIAGIATPHGVGGIGIVRISGEEARNILTRLFHTGVPADKLEARKMYLGRLKTEGFSDRCLAVWFRAPESYTGEDVVELHCHGGQALVQGVLRAVLQSGARLAENGEFSKRAFLNGKLTLTGAEGVIEMINADSEAELNAAYGLLRGDLHSEAAKLQGELTDIISRVEVVLDYPEEEVDLGEIEAPLKKMRIRLRCLEDSYRTGHMLKSGVTVAVCGKPNVGKSSLMNKLLNYDRAIVTEEAGTTRDTLETTMVLHGVKLNLVDTAGIRQGVSGVEKLGIERAREAIKASDIVLFVVDASEELTEQDREIAGLVKGKKVLLICNKADKKGYDPARAAALCNGEIVEISALNGAGVDKLKDRLYRTIEAGKLSQGGMVLTNERHMDVVQRAGKAVDSAIAACGNSLPDAIAMELKNIWDVLGEITGTTATEAIIDNIFSKFCLGK